MKKVVWIVERESKTSNVHAEAFKVVCHAAIE